jgi:hypothetical protein
MRWLARTLDHLIANVALWLAVVGLLFIVSGALMRVFHALGPLR